MNTVPTDVLSRYSILSQRLRNLSKVYDEKTLEGVCNLEISNYDYKNIIIPIFNNYKYSPRAYMVYLGNEDRYEGLFQSHIIYGVPFGKHKQYYETILSSYDKMIDNDIFGIYNKSDDLNIFTGPDTNITGMLEKVEDYSSLFFDVLTISDFYRQKRECVNNIENYVMSKTLEYFNNVVSKLNTDDTILALYLYLVTNCIVLGIDDYKDGNLSKEFAFLNSERKVLIPQIRTINSRKYEFIVKRIKQIL